MESKAREEVCKEIEERFRDVVLVREFSSIGHSPMGRPCTPEELEELERYAPSDGDN